MQQSDCLQRHAAMPATRQRNTCKRTLISVQKLVELRQIKIKSHTSEVDLSLMKHLKNFSGKDINIEEIDADFAIDLHNIL